ncbi:hypothetical protein BT69DRAFT_198911 [Atractiella rhizophila]|nr:hypothetical protein BT69DRAFT_198911 [Atractiella rhizophila]
MQLTHLHNLTWLDVDGGHESSKVLPFDFFNRLCLPRLTGIKISFCFVELERFVHRFSDRSAEVFVELFFGQWEEEDIARVMMRVMDLENDDDREGFYEFELSEDLNNCYSMYLVALSQQT